MQSNAGHFLCATVIQADTRDDFYTLYNISFRVHTPPLTLCLLQRGTLKERNMALGLPEELIPQESSITISCTMKGIFQWLTCTVVNNVDVLLDCFWESTLSSRCKCTRAPVKAPLNELCHHFKSGQNWQSLKRQWTVNHASKCLHHRKFICVVDAKGSFLDDWSCSMFGITQSWQRLEGQKPLAQNTVMLLQ